MSETPMPKTREELRDFFANVSTPVCDGLDIRACVGGELADILAALDKAGLAIVPKEPTEEMNMTMLDQAGWTGAVAVKFYERAPQFWRAMLSASPFSVKP